MVSNNKNFIPEQKCSDLNFTNIYDEITVASGKIPCNKCKFLLHSRFLDFRFFPHIRDEISVLRSLRT